MRLVVLLIIVAAMVAALAVAVLARRRRARRGGALRVAAVVVALGTTVGVLPLVVADRGSAADYAVVLGPPAALTLLGATAPFLRPPVLATVVTWIVAILMFAYVLVYGLGVGGFYTVTAALWLATAITGSLPRERSAAPAAP